MGKTGISIIKGISPDEVVKMLNKAYADEWLAYYQYYIESKVIKGPMKDAVIKELNEHAADELRHATMLVDRIAQLGGTPILNPADWTKYANCGYEAPTDPGVLPILKQAINGEQCAIKTYQQLIDLTHNKDLVTYNMVSEILTDEVEHEEDLQAIYEDIEGFIQKYQG